MLRPATLLNSRIPSYSFAVSELLQHNFRRWWCSQSVKVAVEAGVPMPNCLRASSRAFSCAATPFTIATTSATLPASLSSEKKNITVHVTFDWGNQEKPEKKEDVDHHQNHVQAQKLPNPSNGKRRNVLLDSVVRVLCKHDEPYESKPWSSYYYSSSSSGVILPGKRILTNAHCVENHTSVKLKKGGSKKAYPAAVQVIGTECDCAILTVKDEKFWEGVTPVQFEYSPRLLDSVVVVGYPEGRDVPSVTSGVVKCLNTLKYCHSSTVLPGIEIDAVTSPGSSGGPVFNDEWKCIGLAFQGLRFESLSDVIPARVIQRFLQDYEKNGAYTGFSTLGIRWQDMNDPELRKSMGMPPGRSGIFINEIEPTSLESLNVFRKSDILLSFDGVKIDNDGKVPNAHDEGRVDYNYILFEKYNGETVRVEVLRDSKIVELDVKLANHKRNIISNIKNKPISYYIIAGFVFTSLTKTYLQSKFDYDSEDEDETPIEMLEKLSRTVRSPHEEIVVLSRVLSADINDAYDEDDFENMEVLSFNGVTIKNLKSLAEMVENCKDEFLQFDLEHGKRIVLRAEKAKSSNQEILKKHSIHSTMSDDLLKEFKQPNSS